MSLTLPLQVALFQLFHLEMAQKVPTHGLHVQDLFSVKDKVCVVTGAPFYSSRDARLKG